MEIGALAHSVLFNLMSDYKMVVFWKVWVSEPKLLFYVLVCFSNQGFDSGSVYIAMQKRLCNNIFKEEWDQRNC